jgi:prepilin-type N-terminal cleavage/methylation domain-containing protein
MYRDEKTDGFTLLEILVVLVLMGIMGTIIVSRLVDNPVELTAGAATLKNHIRYAQARGMNSDNLWGIRYDSATKTYWLFEYDGVTETRALLPGESTDSLPLGDDNQTLNGLTVVVFDNWGRPYLGNLGSTPGGGVFSLQEGGLSVSVTMADETGFMR